MSEKPKRPWFRFHLLTLVLMALAAGGMMLVNLTGREVKIDLQNVVVHVRFYGWPVEVLKSYDTDKDTLKRLPENEYHLLGEDGLVGIPAKNSSYLAIWILMRLLPDVLIWVIILAAIAAVSESLLRRREGRKL